MKRILTLIFWIGTLALQAQENIDSLISTWNKLGKEFLEIHELDSACKYGNCVIDIMAHNRLPGDMNMSDERKINLEKKKAEALSTLVTAYGGSDKIDLSNQSYDSAFHIYSAIGDKNELFKLHIRMGRVHDLRSDYGEAIIYYEKARDQAILNNDKKGLSLSYYFLGLDHRYLGNYSEALKNHYEDLKIQEELSNTVGIANAYVTIAAILNKLNDRDAAIEKLMDAKSLFENMEDTSGVAMIYNDLGTTYYQMGDTLGALENHLQAAKLRMLVDEFNGLGASYSYIARIYKDRGDFNQAHNYLHLVEKAFHNSSNLNGIMTTQIDMARLHFRKKEMDSTIVWLNIAHKTATQMMNYRGLILIYSIRGEVELFQKIP
ncbi:MAG: tetratricopeptide repeat protein [Bacteroidales bacterium]